MGLFDFLFARKSAAPQPQATGSAPQRNDAAQSAVPFDGHFIARLKDEHRALVGLFVAVRKANEAKDFAAVKSGLQEFQMALNMHLAVENARFYAYLRRKLIKGSPQMATMDAFFDEMQEIGKVVGQFLRQYSLAEFTAEVQAAFSQELEAIGAALASRIDREEQTLYTLYVPA